MSLITMMRKALSRRLRKVAMLARLTGLPSIMNLASQPNVLKMRSKRKAKCSFAYAQIKSSSPAPQQSSTSIMYSCNSSSSSYCVHEVHHSARCPLLQQEFPLWTRLQLLASCQPELSGTRTAHHYLLAAVVTMVDVEVQQVFWMQLFAFRMWS